MELKLVEDPESSLKVTITYPVTNPEVQQLIKQIKQLEIKIPGTVEGKQIYIEIEGIYYIESLERKTFIYTQNQILRSYKKFYQLLEELKPYGFLQISKGCILNINKLEHVRPLLNSRLEAMLTNGEKVIIARTYIPMVKEWLEKEAEVDETNE